MGHKDDYETMYNDLYNDPIARITLVWLLLPPASPSRLISQTLFSSVYVICSAVNVMCDYFWHYPSRQGPGIEDNQASVSMNQCLSKGISLPNTTNKPSTCPDQRERTHDAMSKAAEEIVVSTLYHC